MTHKKGSPWSQVYVEGIKNILIPLESIKKYFEENEQCDLFQLAFSEEDYADYTNEDGEYILPGEWDE